jgi:hypothetical protein
MGFAFLINMRYLHKFENYTFIADFKLEDISDKLSEIESFFGLLKKDEVNDCLVELNDIGKVNIDAVLWKGGDMVEKILNTTNSGKFKYLSLDKYYEPYQVVSEVLDFVAKYKREDYIEMIINNPRYFNTYKNLIIDEVENFQKKLKDNPIPCLRATIWDLKNWKTKQAIIDVLFDIKHKLKVLFDKDIVFFDDYDKVNFLIIDSEHINKI